MSKSVMNRAFRCAVVPEVSRVSIEIKGDIIVTDSRTVTGGKPVGIYQDVGGQSEETIQASMNSHLQELLKPLKADYWAFRLEDLSQETDPKIYWSDVYDLALHCRRQEQDSVALGIFHLVSQTEGVPEEIQAKARADYHAMVGIGSVGNRLEFLSSRFVSQATDYRMVLPMMGGSMIYQTVRAGSLLGMASRPAAWWNRGMSARTLAATAGFAAELPTFVGMGRGLRSMAGEPLAPLSQEFLSAGIVLGALKFSAFFGNQVFHRVHSINELGQATRLGAFTKFSQVAYPQASMLAGLMAGHGLEVHLGIRPSVDGATLVTDSLSTMLSLGVGSRLGHLVLGPRFNALQKEFGMQAEVYFKHQERFQSGGPPIEFRAPWNMALASDGFTVGLRPLLMTGKNPDSPGSRSKNLSSPGKPRLNKRILFPEEAKDLEIWLGKIGELKEDSEKLAKELVDGFIGNIEENFESNSETELLILKAQQIFDPRKKNRSGGTNELPLNVESMDLLGPQVSHANWNHFDQFIDPRLGQAPVADFQIKPFRGKGQPNWNWNYLTLDGRGRLINVAIYPTREAAPDQLVLPVLMPKGQAVILFFDPDTPWRTPAQQAAAENLYDLTQSGRDAQFKANPYGFQFMGIVSPGDLNWAATFSELQASVEKHIEYRNPDVQNLGLHFARRTDGSVKIFWDPNLTGEWHSKHPRFVEPGLSAILKLKPGPDSVDLVDFQLGDPIQPDPVLRAPLKYFLTHLKVNRTVTDMSQLLESNSGITQPVPFQRVIAESNIRNLQAFSRRFEGNNFGRDLSALARPLGDKITPQARWFFLKLNNDGQILNVSLEKPAEAPEHLVLPVLMNNNGTIILWYNSHEAWKNSMQEQALLDLYTVTGEFRKQFDQERPLDRNMWGVVYPHEINWKQFLDQLPSILEQRLGSRAQSEVPIDLLVARDQNNVPMVAWDSQPTQPSSFGTYPHLRVQIKLQKVQGVTYLTEYQIRPPEINSAFDEALTEPLTGVLEYLKETPPVENSEKKSNAKRSWFSWRKRDSSSEGPAWYVQLWNRAWGKPNWTGPKKYFVWKKKMGTYEFYYPRPQNVYQAGSVLLGRGDQVALKIEGDPSLSREHVKIFRVPRGRQVTYSIEVISRVNGIIKNGEAFGPGSPRQPLVPGDRILVGKDVDFIFVGEK